MIPIAKPFLGKEEVEAAKQVILSGWVTQGPKVKEFEEAFAAYVGAQRACAVTSCTAALHLALLAVGVQPGDVVLAVSHSFISTANTIRYCGAEPVFVDIDADTFGMSAEHLQKCLTNECETRGGQLFYKKVGTLAVDGSPLQKIPAEFQGRVAAVLVVHQIGLPCDLPKILPLAKQFNLPVIEDAACAIGSEISFDQGKSWEKVGRPHGDIACFSFHPRKVLTTGEGGMLTTNKAEYDQQLRLLRHQGMSVSDLTRHQSKSVIIEEYPQLGYNYRLTDIQAAIGIEQLKKLPEMLSRRQEIANFYHKALSKISWFKVPSDPEYGRSNWQSYPVTVLEEAPVKRDQIMQALLDQDIASRRGVMNAHEEQPYKDMGWTLPESEQAAHSVVLLPIFHLLTDKELKKIADAFANLAK